MFFRKKEKIELSPEEKIKILNEKFEVTRILKGPLAKITTAAAVCMSLYHLVSAGFYMLPQPQHKAIHLAFALALTFIIYPARKKDRNRFPWYDMVFTVLGAAVGLYIVIFYWDLVYRLGAPNSVDIMFGGAAILLTLEATRRTMGWPLVIVALVFLGYAVFGQFLPGDFGHKGYELTRIIEHMYLTGEGIFGVAIYVTATYVIIFILLGSFLGVTGGAQSFIDLAFSITGRYRGGPAKAAVVGSGLMGMISGSSFANVAGTGTFTIPLMKSVGYRPEFAGGVEAAASSGGQIMPPIMGAAAFIMAEMTGVPYGKLIINAALPALLYYLAVFVMVDLEAARQGLAGLKKDQLPDFWKTLKNGAFLLLAPLSIFYMLIRGYSPIKASFFAVVIVIVTSMFKKETRLNLKKTLEALDRGARGALSVIAACAVAGLIVGSVTLTGLGLKFADLIITLSGGNLYAALFLTMLAAIMMSMGMPTTALYIILGAIVAPALVKMGVMVIAAHLFIFYYGCFAAVTPPVALSSYLAAAIAKADPVKTALNGLKLTSTAFLMPFIFVLSPAMLLVNTTVIKTLGVILTAVIGVFSLSWSLQGYNFQRINGPARLLLLIAALVLIKPGVVSDVIGLAIIAAVLLVQLYRARGKDKDLLKTGVTK
ncbi:MAG: TRAP transporter permease [Peptococcaceae bacterium]|jgi:TRAP transporter 4TM/12TM fusion protein|nr:TRAP transporter permease [Peptococcaceae bacterium]MDH7523930.1 TRAP transporter permease [Peptococcaceae bacterium]